MSNLQKFNFEHNEVRTQMIDDEIYFIGKDVSDLLGYSNSPKALRDHVDNEDKLTERIVMAGQNREVTIINESGLYSLVLKSKLPSAKKFKRWVTKEVLPSIRKHGAYATQKQATSPELQFMQGAVQWMSNYETAFKQLEQKVEAMEEKREICIQEEMDLEPRLYTTKEIAEQFGFHGTGGVHRVNQLLKTKRVIYSTRPKSKRAGFVWHLYKKHQGKGYKDLSSVAKSQMWTEKGKRFIEDVIKNELN